MLSGLSSAQHKWELVSDGVSAAATAEEEANAGMVEATFTAGALTSWTVSPYLDEAQLFDEQDRIVPLHPVYAVPVECAADIKAYFDAKQGF